MSADAVAVVARGEHGGVGELRGVEWWEERRCVARGACRRTTFERGARRVELARHHRVSLHTPLSQSSSDPLRPQCHAKDIPLPY